MQWDNQFEKPSNLVAAFQVQEKNGKVMEGSEQLLVVPDPYPVARRLRDSLIGIAAGIGVSLIGQEVTSQVGNTLGFPKSPDELQGYLEATRAMGILWTGTWGGVIGSYFPEIRREILNLSRPQLPGS